MYNQDLERVKPFKLLGVWFDEKLTWGIHIQKIVDKCEKLDYFDEVFREKRMGSR